MREMRPQVVITYDENGGYGHPDHIQAHRVTVAAFDLSGDPGYEPELGEPWQPAKLYYSAIARSEFREGMKALASAASTPDSHEEPAFIVDDELVTTASTPATSSRRRSPRCARTQSQIAVGRLFYAMADGGGRALFAHETFRLVRGELGPTGADGREDDVFAGIGE